jgi:hypothetical protein
MQKVPIDLFTMLYNLAVSHGVSQTEWAEKSGMDQPRIAELVQLADGKDIRRAFTADKCQALIRGLKKILGGAVVTKELLKMLEKEPDIDKRLLIIMVTLLDAPAETKKALEMYCQNLLQMVIKKQ